MFGWASIVPVLEDVPVFRNQTDADRTLSLGLIFTVASSMTFVAPAFTGAFLTIHTR